METIHESFVDVRKFLVIGESNFWRGGTNTLKKKSFVFFRSLNFEFEIEGKTRLNSHITEF